jgi:hypothetical protein
MTHTLTVHRFELTDPRLGRHVEHDSRSLRFLVTAKTALKTTYWPTIAPGLDQGQVGSCTGNAPAQLINSQLWTPIREKILGPGKFADETYALKIYHENTVLDGYPGTYPPDDTGSSGLAAAKSLEKFGLAGSYRHAVSMTTLISGLQTGPCIVGTEWTSGMFNTDKNYYVKPTGKVEGGHEYWCIGCDLERQELWFRNSWGASWGTEIPNVCPSQAFRITIPNFTKLLAAQGDATFPIPVAA